MGRTDSGKGIKSTTACESIISEEQEGPGRFDQGTIIGGRYRLRGRIGQGGMGEVFAAEDMRLQGKIRALKASPAAGGGVLRSAEEAGLLMRLNHPHLPLIVDYFPAAENGGYEVMVMDYIDGMTLQSCLERQEGFIPADKVAAIGIQLAEALRYLHAQQPPIIHRDLKPTNAMIDRSGFVRLIDFGIAREFKPGRIQDTATLGTPGFAAPEQEGERQSDARTDVFGLGALLRYLLTGGGKRPERDGDGSSGGESAAMRGMSGGASSLTAVIGRMTHPLPDCRFASMTEVKAALEACCGGSMAASTAGGDSAPIARGPAVRHRQRSVMVASLSPGAGGTFTALTLAQLMDRESGPTLALVEHPSLEPEWHALLPAANRNQGPYGAMPPADDRYAVLRSPSAKVAWYRLDPEAHDGGQVTELELKHRMMLQAIEACVVITDVSSRWLAPETEKQLAACDRLLFVADPFPSKWTVQRLAAAKRICMERERRGLPTCWIANKDGKFGARGEWLASMPAKPGCSIPLLPAQEWADAVWRGRWATSDQRWRPRLERALLPVLRAISGNV